VPYSVSQKNYAQARKRERQREQRPNDQVKNHYGATVNYCPVCKREYKDMGGKQTGLCPVCRSTLVQLRDEAMDKVRRENKPGKN
jgi:hypothetical protein